MGIRGFHPVKFRAPERGNAHRLKAKFEEVKKLKKIVDVLERYQDLGFPYMNTNDQNFLKDFIKENLEVCPEPLYRGVITTENEFNNFEVGELIDFKELFASFSEDYDIALSFIKHDDTDKEEYLIPYAIIFQIEDAEGLPLYVYTENQNELEWLIADRRFKIKEIEEVEDDEKLKIITVE